MFIQTEQTPNPNTLKFLPGREVMAEATAHFPDAESARRSPLAERLFAIESVVGVSSVETAGIGGAAHLVNFKGTDTVAALEVARVYYQEDMAGFSIPASEHSTITAWGIENENMAMENMLDQYPTGLVACVSDSYDIFNAIKHIWGRELKNKIMERDGTLVIRPDSGDPVTIVLQCLELLGDKFGYTLNDKSYKVLDPHVRVIQGDGIDIDMLPKILDNLKEHGWSGDNIAFGSGGGLLQKLNRDTLKFAFKCSATHSHDRWHEVYKDPVTDAGKQSKRGRLKLVRHFGAHGAGYLTKSIDEFEEDTESQFNDDEMDTVFLNGAITKEHTLNDIRERARLPAELAHSN